MAKLNFKIYKSLGSAILPATDDPKGENKDIDLNELLGWSPKIGIKDRLERIVAIWIYVKFIPSRSATIASI